MTSDNLGIKFDAALTVRVTDPKAAVSMLCPMAEESAQAFSSKALFRTIADKAKLSLSIIIGNSRLNRVFKATTRTVAARTPFESDALLDAQPTPPQAQARTAYGKLAAQDSEDPEDASSSFKQNVVRVSAS